MALLNLAQVKGGPALQADVNALKTSYDAAKVITSIVKDSNANPATYYNVDEYLQIIKTTLDGIAGGGSGDTTALETAINNIANKTIYDVVRVQLKAHYNAANETWTITDIYNQPISADSNNLIFNGIDVQNLNDDYCVAYTLDNKVIYDTYGQQLGFGLWTNVFSGDPAILDVAASKASVTGDLVYKTYTQDFDFKIFVNGQFTLSNIPEAALLDNNELALIAYDQAIQKIIIELAKDDDVIAAITDKVGAETVANQITAITDALETRIAALESGKIDKTSIVKTKTFVEVGVLPSASDAVEGTIYKINNMYFRFDGIDENTNDPIWTSLTDEDMQDVADVASASDDKVVSEKVFAKKLAEINTAIANAGNSGDYVRKADVLVDGPTIVSALPTVGEADTVYQLSTDNSYHQYFNDTWIDLTAEQATALLADQGIHAYANASNDKVVSEKLLAKNFDTLTSAYSSISTSVQNLSNRITGLETMAASVDDKITVDSANPVTVFQLSQTPNDELVQMFFGGATYFEGDEFTVDRLLNRVTWTFTAVNNGFDITDDVTSYVRFRYKTGSTIVNTSTCTILHQDAVPVSGTYKAGDLIFRVHASQGQNLGWICTTAGTPGTWTEFGIVDFGGTITPIE